MVVFAIGIEHPNVIAVDGPKRGDTREEHPSAFPFGRVGQHLGRRKNFRQVLFRFGDSFGEI